jgi:CheY-like chemotaxis protein
MHGGSVRAFSPGPGQGSEFVVRLPLRPEAPAPAAATEPSPAPAAGRPLRILIVDDNIDGAESCGQLLRMEGHQVQVAHDGPAALALAPAFRPEVVLLDIGLPKGMDGFAVCRRLRQEAGLSTALIIAVTGYGQEDDRQRAREAGFNAHVVKPVNLDALHHLLAEHIAGGGAEA